MRGGIFPPVILAEQRHPGTLEFALDHVIDHEPATDAKFNCDEVATTTPMRPNIKVPAVGVGVLTIQNGLILLGKRRGSPGAGTWAAPGGRLDFAESIENCARRELLEETGLSASSIELGPYTNDVFEDVAEHYLTVFVIARGLSGHPQNLEPDKCEGWAWFAWGEFPHPLFKPLQNLLAIGWRPGGA